MIAPKLPPLERVSVSPAFHLPCIVCRAHLREVIGAPGSQRGQEGLTGWLQSVAIGDVYAVARRR
jgi:hypothetical protein